ncbi:nitrate reductase molybdenum cofactor assembly chaperone [Aquibacillus kalidii]|uniref:nitrate reductase molybdenum cofactor assembly chaperone n=1 Tax=Aquibacillus kalidii TaxID=2762597 RepID=UPI0016492DD7|nr:nitrate reductase molybdenum cofactor assembly chaperone [Aquibacillus kalidii]
MKEYQSDLLLMASRLLSYPSNEDREIILDGMAEIEVPKDLRVKLEEAVDTVCRVSLPELQETYVETFDLKEKLGLYLSAHEFGDSPKRGAALIKLQKIINQAGYEREEGELADYIPMLYEFLAVSGETADSERLFKRLSCVTQRILNHLTDDSPYRFIFSVMMEYVFEAPTKQELQDMETNREQADLEELPYPIMYK